MKFCVLLKTRFLCIEPLAQAPRDNDVQGCSSGGSRRFQCEDEGHGHAHTHFPVPGHITPLQV